MLGDVADMAGMAAFVLSVIAMRATRMDDRARPNAEE